MSISEKIVRDDIFDESKWNNNVPWIKNDEGVFWIIPKERLFLFFLIMISLTIFQVFYIGLVIGSIGLGIYKMEIVWFVVMNILLILVPFLSTIIFVLLLLMLGTCKYLPKKAKRKKKKKELGELAIELE